MSTFTAYETNEHFNVEFLVETGPTRHLNLDLVSTLFFLLIISIYFTNICYSVYWESTSVALRETFLLNIISSFRNETFSGKLCRAVKCANRPLCVQIIEAPYLM